MAPSQASATQTRGSDNGFQATYTDDGQPIRPVGWRKWVYIGTPITPNDMNDGKAAFPEFHNVYIAPESFATFERTGEFPDGTQIAKELVLVGSKAAVSGKGYFMGEFNAMKAAMGAMGEKMDASSDKEENYQERVFKCLAAKKYPDFVSDTTVHPSTAGPAVAQ